MKAELKTLHSPDVNDLRSFVPAAPERFSVFVQAMIGPAGDDSWESFDIVVCSPGSLAQEAESGPVLGLHRIVMAKFDYDALAGTISTFCEQCEGTTWPEVARRLARLGRWEFEDYHEYAEVAPVRR
jgi:hypothetical protein